MPSDEVQSNLFVLTIDNTTQSHLLTIAKWHRFIGIFGMIGCFFLMISVLWSDLYNYKQYAENQSIDYAEKIGEIIGSLLVIGALFTPCVLQLRFANRVTKALKTKDQHLINQSFRLLKISSKYVGISLVLWAALMIGFFMLSLTQAL